MGRATRAEKKRRRRTGFFIFEVIILIVLMIALFAVAKLQGAFEGVYVPWDFNKRPEVNENVDKEKFEGYTLIALVGLDTRDDGSDESGLKNSDTMIICAINHDTKEVKLVSVYRDTYLNVGDGHYTKANEAYATGDARQFLSMLNKNLDLHLENYVTVEFGAVVEAIDILGGIDDVELTRDEIIHLNNYCVGTSAATGVSYESLPEKAGVYNLTGVQAVSYARIRYGNGLDFRRAARQRLVINKMVEKVKASPQKLNELLDKVCTPEYIQTSLKSNEMMNLGWAMLDYNFAEDGQKGFPFHHIFGENVKKAVGQDVVLPVTLEVNVRELHQFLFPEMADYEPSNEVKDYSEYIINESGYGEGSIPEHSEDGTIPALQDAS